MFESLKMFLEERALLIGIAVVLGLAGLFTWRVCKILFQEED